MHFIICLNAHILTENVQSNVKPYLRSPSHLKFEQIMNSKDKTTLGKLSKLKKILDRFL